jgi:putative transposase
VNDPLTDGEMEGVRQCVRRGAPFGSSSWVRETATRLGLESTLRPRGRPRKQAQGTGEECPLFAFHWGRIGIISIAAGHT